MYAFGGVEIHFVTCNDWDEMSVPGSFTAPPVEETDMFDSQKVEDNLY